MDPDTAERAGIVVFEGEHDGEPRVGIVLKEVPLIEFEGSVMPGCLMTAEEARRIGQALIDHADDLGK